MFEGRQSVLLKAKNLSMLDLWRNISFEVSAGQILHIIGANGIGKTTLIKILCGLRYPDKGWVLWGQLDIHCHRDDYYQEIIYVGHKDGIKLDLTPAENLDFFAALHRNDGKGNDEDSRIETALLRWQLGDLASPCRLLSAGQCRRTALARLLVVSARLWFLDEPLTTLDSTGSETLGEIIKMHLDAGGAVVMSTHQLPDWSLPAEVLSLDRGS